MMIYCKQPGEEPIPITVRLKWLPDGTIHPLCYWLPDDSYHEIKYIHNMTPLKYLRDGGVGVRFKVSTTAPGGQRSFRCDDKGIVLYDNCLYLADNRFCGKPFIDERYSHNAKEYIPIVIDVFPNGEYGLVSFWVQGVRYSVEKTLEVAKRGSFAAGGIGLRHKVEARLVNEDDDECPDINNSVRRLAALYFEVDKWWVGRSITAAE